MNEEKNNDSVPSMDINLPDVEHVGYQSKDILIRKVTKCYIDNFDPDQLYDPAELADELLFFTRKLFSDYNKSVSVENRHQLPDKLYPAQVSALMRACYSIRNITCNATTDPDNEVLVIYNDCGTNEGIYTRDRKTFDQIIKQYVYTSNARFLDEVYNDLRKKAPRVTQNTNRDLIAVNNGIFDFKNKILLTFTPDIVFLAKSRVDYVPWATNPVIHNDEDGTDWDVESWVSDLFDDDEIVQLMWEIMSAIVRPYVRWNRSAWFYSETGCNGKGTMLELMRNLCGPGSYASIPLTDFGKDFALENLINATAILTDENDVGCYIDKAANLKTISTCDVLHINIKYKPHVDFQFFGFMVQCLNEYPRVKDRSGSFYRRQLFILFDKCFTGKDRKYIKEDYLKRKEVLEYVLKKVLNMNHYSLSEPKACKEALADYKYFNDPVRQFLDEILGQLVWDFVPLIFVYDLYKSWYKKNSPSGQVQGKISLYRDIKALIPEYKEWSFIDTKISVRPGNKMDPVELLIAEYNLVDWYDPYYSGADRNRLCKPLLQANYKGGLERV